MNQTRKTLTQIKAMRTTNRSDAIENGERARLARTGRRLADQPSAQNGSRFNSTFELQKPSARRRWQRPRRSRSPLFAESFALGRRVVALMACCATTLLLTPALKAQAF